MVITEYGNMFSLYIFGLLLLPAVVMGCLGKKIHYYGIVISIPILYMLMGEHLKNFLIILCLDIAILYLYYRFYRKYKYTWIYYLTLVLMVLPVVEVKAAYCWDFNAWAFLGISYFGFRIWQLVIEIHDGHIDNFNICEILYFLCFFPSVSSGPIDRYKRFSLEIKSDIGGSIYIDKYLIPGIKKIFWGIIYKFSIAEFINIFFLNKISSEVSVVTSLAYMYVYTMYLFFDFAGYSLMAIGTGYLLGITLPDNFNKPFLSRNMKEFWERWHISLSRWFGDYLFSRLVLNFLRSGVIKKQKTAIRFAYMITMLTMGIWHGFTTYYILYGLYHGIMLVISDIYVKSKSYRKHIKLPYYNFVSRVICFHFIAFGMLIFSGYLFK